MASKNQRAVRELCFKLEQFGERVVRGLHKQLELEAENIAETAREYAPVDTHNLEKSIKVRTEGGSNFVRKSWTIYVDEDARNGNKTVGSYAWEMHEMLAPYGTGEYHLGEKSQAKDGGRGIVGGKFMERAVEDNKYGMIERCEQSVSQAVRGKVNVGIKPVRNGR